MRKGLALLLLLCTLLTACSAKPLSPTPNPKKPILIGLSLAKLSEERWHRDRDLFVAKARELGAEVIAYDRLILKANVDLAAIGRIVAGTQSMTVYKPIRILAERAAEVAVSMAKGGEPQINTYVYNGAHQVPSYLLEPIPVDKQNWRETVVKDGFHREEEILSGPAQES